MGWHTHINNIHWGGYCLTTGISLDLKGEDYQITGNPTEAEEGQSQNILQIQKNILNRNVFLKSLSKSLSNLKNYCKS